MPTYQAMTHLASTPRTLVRSDNEGIYPVLRAVVFPPRPNTPLQRFTLAQLHSYQRLGLIRDHACTSRERAASECIQCDEHRHTEVLGLCRPCYDAARALGFSDTEIADRTSTLRDLASFIVQ